MTQAIRTYWIDRRWIRMGSDVLITSILWIYFTLGFIIFFGPFYLIALLLPFYRMRIFQSLNHYFYRGFFRLCRILIPGLKWRIDPAIRQLRSSVIVCNHISFIDSILLISLIKNHTTIVKERLFHIPILGHLVKLSGYLPSSANGTLSEIMSKRLDTLCKDLTRGSCLIVFPEGTRSRDGNIGRFNPGAFKIARLCRRPIHVLHIRNSDKLFKPGRFLFNTSSRDNITLSSISCIESDYDAPSFSISRLINQVHEQMKTRNQEHDSVTFDAAAEMEKLDSAL